MDPEALPTTVANRQYVGRGQSKVCLTVNPSPRSLVASLAAAVCLWPVSVSVTQAQGAAPSAPALTVEQVRNSFSHAGFQVQQSRTWDWTSPPVTSFQIQDQTGARVLMVLVYANSAAAQTAYVQAQARDEAQGSASRPGADGPHLVDGYGPSVWKANVALVQTTQSELDRLYRVHSDRDNCVDTNLTLVQDPGPPSVMVDVDFQQALDTGVLASASPST